MKKLVLLLLLCCSTSHIFPQTLFSDTLYPFGNYLSTFETVKDCDSFYVAQAEWSSQKSLLKLDMNGNLIMKKSFPDSAIGIAPFENNSYVWLNDRFVNATARPDSVQNSAYHLSLIAFDYAFNVLWQKDYRQLNVSHNVFSVLPTKMHQTPEGGFIVAGNAVIDTLGTHTHFPFLFKASSNGTPQWFRIYRNYPDAYFDDLELTSDMGLIAYSGQDNGTLFKFNALGTLQNTTILNNLSDTSVMVTHDMAHLGNGEVMVAKVLFSKPKHTINLVRFNYLSWQKEVDTTYRYFFTIPPHMLQVRELPGSELLICGTASFVKDSVNSDPYTLYGCQEKLFLYRVNQWGDSLALQTYSFDTTRHQSHWFADISLSDDGGAFVSGQIVGDDYFAGWLLRTLPGSITTDLPKTNDVQLHLVSFSLFPNPSSGRITVDLSPVYDKRDLKIYMYSSDQSLLQIKDVGMESFPTMDLSLYPDGVYFLALRRGEKQLGLKKVVKAKD